MMATTLRVHHVVPVFLSMGLLTCMGCSDEKGSVTQRADTQKRGSQLPKGKRVKKVAQKAKSPSEKLLGDWQGTASGFYGGNYSVLARRVKLRFKGNAVTITDELRGKIGLPTAFSCKFTLKPNPIQLVQTLKDDFGEVTERKTVKAYQISFNPHDAPEATPMVYKNYRYLVFDSENRIQIHTHKYLITKVGNPEWDIGALILNKI